MTSLTPLQVLTEKWSIDKYNLRIIVELLEAQIAEREGMKGEDALRLNTFREGHKDGWNEALSEMNKRDGKLVEEIKKLM